MRVNIQSRGFELTPALRTHAERRLAFALSRFEQRLQAVSVRLADENGPRGGVDKRCVLRVRMMGLPEAVITECAEDLYAAIDRAADRAGRTVARRLRRRHDSLAAVPDGVRG